ncbi:MAG: tRNA epoxyqueuosine(34) reductase QueG [Bacteroidota bacterium]
MINKNYHTNLVKQTASELGFSYCGITKAVKLDEDAKRLELWLNKGMQGSMHYMENHFDLRIDPTKLVPGAKSVITLLQNYYPEAIQLADSPKIAKYAWGKDYHDIIRNKMKELLFLLKQGIGEINGRGFVDSAPVLERTWALKSGIGWIGKNGNLITKENGSFFFIANLIVDIELNYDDPYAKDYCGTCNKCVEACPTQAILDNKVVDGSKCISYFTIELKDALIPESMKGKFDNWLFGCDTCQDICPWNRFSSPHAEPNFTPIPEILDLNTGEWEMMTMERFLQVFKDSPLRRSKYEGIRRNLRFIKTSD